MSEVDVLGLIWENKVSKRDLKQMSPLGLLLQTLLGKPVVGFVSHTPIPRPCAKLDTEEVLGEASLGDILFQELGIDTPNDSVILFEPESFAAAQEYSSSKLGRLLGDVLVELSGINLESTILQQPEYGLPARVKSPDTIEYF